MTFDLYIMFSKFACVNGLYNSDYFSLIDIKIEMNISDITLCNLLVENREANNIVIFVAFPFFFCCADARVLGKLIELLHT